MDNNNTVDLSDGIKARSASGAAAKLAGLPAAELVSQLMHLSPGFTQDVIDTWIEYKRIEEHDAVALRPHPYEFGLYYDV